MAFNTSFGRTEGWHETDKFQSQLRTKPQSGDFFARLTQSGQEVLSGGNTAALNEVLRQFNEEKSRYQMEMENMKVNIRTNEAMLRQIAEALLGGSFEQAMQKSRKDLERQQQQMDLQAAALREAITHFEDHKATYAIDHADTKRVIDEMREDFSIETKGCIEAASSKVVQECRSSLTEELARIRKEMASLGDELKQKMEEDRSAQDGKVKKMEELHEVVGKKLDDLELRFQQQPDPSTTVNAINAAMVANEKEAAKIQNALEEVSSSAAKMDQQRALFESRVSEAVKSCQDANAGAAKAVEMAQSHSEEAQRATTAVVTAATSAESQAQEAREAVQVLHNVAATAENHAQKAFEAKAAAEQAVETTAGHMLATTNALASVQSNVSSAENYAQAAAEAKAASQVAAESAESCKAAAADALSALQAKVASAESHAQTAFESKSAAERSAEASENHMVAATNALTAVQSNAESVREKTTEVEQHAASVKEIVLQMTEQASALQETTSAVAAASDRAILAVASEADRQVATIEEKLRSSQVAATKAVESESAMCQELENKMQDQKAQIAEVRGNLAECAQITHVLSQKVEAVESQFMAELSSHKEDVMQRFHRHEELTSPKAGEEGVSRARLEEMISTALERTEHLEQSMVGIASEKHSVQFPEEVSRTHAALQAEINDLKTRNASSEARLDELARAEGRLPASPRKVLLRPEELQVRSVPAALCGMVQSALPVPSDTKNRKALIIGCSYYESNNPLSGAFNDAWNVLSLLRHTLQFSESQVRFLVDGSRRCPMPQPRRPTAAVITESLQWLTQDAQSGDAIFLYFAGYGLLLPHGVGTFESCLVPIDYAAMASPPHDTGSGYRLIPLMDVSLALSKLPAGCQATVVLDCCHSSLPGVGSASQPAIFHWAQMQPPAFAGLEEDLPEGFYPKARWLVLPSVPIQTPRSMQAATFNCSLTCFSACQQAQWCAELPIEGVMQGAFTWAWVKAMVANGGVIKSPTQMKGSVEAHVADLQKRYRWLDQEPMVQMSKVVEQQELGRIEVPALPSVLQKPLPQGDFRRKALIIGSNYTGSHAQLKGAVNDAWNMYTLLRHALALDDAQVRLLVDGENGAKASPTQVPSKANILMNFQWLMEGAQPGDSLVLVFCGFGTQHPKDHEGKDYEAFLVPSDYAADLPKDWLTQANAPVPPGVPKSVPKAPPGAAYRLISMLELNRFIMQIPAGAALTTILDCSYPALPGVSPSCNIPPTFPKVPRGRVDYDKMFDFVTRPRFLELPPLPVQHTLPQIWKPQTYPTCQLHCFCAGRLQEWPSELPLEGTVQGTFTWAFAKAFAAGELRSTVAQQQQALEGITAQLKQHFQGVEQSPVLMLSQSASSSDSVFA